MAGRNAVTVLAPVNGAKGMRELLAFVDGPEATEAREKKAASGIAEWTLTYHVINGMLPTEKIPANSFPKTFVHSAAFANVSGGQKLHVTKEGGKVVIYSAVENNATVTQAVSIAPIDGLLRRGLGEANQSRISNSMVVLSISSILFLLFPRHPSPPQRQLG